MKTETIDKWLDIIHEPIDEMVWGCFVNIFWLSKDISSMDITKSIRDACVIGMMDDIARIQDVDILEVLIDADKIFQSDLLLSLMKVSEYDSKIFYFELLEKYVCSKIVEFIEKKTL